MARPRQIEEEDLIFRLATAFAETGFEGASLAVLSEATGLKRASLYHRFPGGKTQMAEEVLAAAVGWMGENVIALLSGDGPPEDRLARAAAKLDEFYDGGRRSCLLNMLSSPKMEEGPFGPAIRDAFAALVGAFATLAKDAGASPAEAERRAERAVMLLHGSLVMCRGTGNRAPFRLFLGSLGPELLQKDLPG